MKQSRVVFVGKMKTRDLIITIVMIGNSCQQLCPRFYGRKFVNIMMINIDSQQVLLYQNCYQLFLILRSFPTAFTQQPYYQFCYKHWYNPLHSNNDNENKLQQAKNTATTTSSEIIVDGHLLNNACWVGCYHGMEWTNLILQQLQLCMTLFKYLPLQHLINTIDFYRPFII